MIEVRKIAAKDTYSLRHSVLWPHLKEHECGIDSDLLDEAFQLGSFYNDQLISIGTFFPQQHDQFECSKQFRLRAMATDPDFRGLDSGKKLMEAAFMYLQAIDVDLLWCDARLIATGFYEKLGMSVMGEIYDVPKIGPHKLMYIKLR